MDVDELEAVVDAMAEEGGDQIDALYDTVTLNKDTYNGFVCRLREVIRLAKKRSKYERLYECFWDKRAVQCVVRQMLDERDDLSGIDPVSANRMEYFANQLIGAASDGKSFGNSAALREAVDYLCERMADMDATFDPSEVECLRAALSAPPRNCDVPHKDGHELWVRWQNYGTEIFPSRVSFSTWLLATAKEGGSK